MAKKQGAFFFDRLRTLRERAGVTQTRLAKTADMDRGTISRVESHEAARKETLYAIGNALNDLHYRKNGAELNLEREITTKPKRG